MTRPTGTCQLIVTAFDERVLEKPQLDSESVSDVVMGDLVKRTGEQKNWFSVQLPDGRAGFLPKKAAQDYKTWVHSRNPTADNIEKTARMFLGRPYLWGLGAFGQPGVERVLELLRIELRAAMQQVGAATVKDLKPSHVRRA